MESTKDVMNFGEDNETTFYDGDVIGTKISGRSGALTLDRVMSGKENRNGEFLISRGV